MSDIYRFFFQYGLNFDHLPIEDTYIHSRACTCIRFEKYMYVAWGDKQYFQERPTYPQLRVRL